MRHVDLELESELLRALRQLRRALDRLTGCMAGSAGSVAVLEVWAWRRGSSPLLQDLAVAAGAAALVTLGLWLSARRDLRRWIRAVDARLGAGAGRALLELGSFQEGAFTLEEGLEGLTLGERPKKG